jgi:cupin fold WbuC family metalloprotein
MISISKNNEVLKSTDEIQVISENYINSLEFDAKMNVRKRIRRCTHIEVTDLVHEMFIVHEKNTYVRPHKHPGKSESLLVLKGEVDFITFDELGNVNKVIELSNNEAGNEFYIRLNSSIYHSLFIRSEYLIFLEVTSGPFVRDDMIFAPWSPDDNSIGLDKYLVELNKNVNDWKYKHIKL